MKYTVMKKDANVNNIAIENLLNYFVPGDSEKKPKNWEKIQIIDQMVMLRIQGKNCYFWNCPTFLLTV